MSTFQLNGKDFVSQTSSAEPVIASTVTGGEGCRTWTKLSETDASNDATILCGSTSIFTSTYSMYCIQITGLEFASNADMHAKLKLNGAVKTSDYVYTQHRANGTNNALANSTSDSKMRMGNNVSGANYVIATGDCYAGGYVYVHNPENTSHLTHLYSTVWFIDDSDLAYQGTMIGYYKGTDCNNALEGVEFSASTGNITSGKFVTSGIRD